MPKNKYVSSKAELKILGEYKSWIQSLPELGPEKGRLANLSRVSNVHPVMLTTILNGNQALTTQTALKIEAALKSLKVNTDDHNGEDLLFDLLEAQIQKAKSEMKFTPGVLKTVETPVKEPKAAKVKEPKAKVVKEPKAKVVKEVKAKEPKAEKVKAVKPVKEPVKDKFTKPEKAATPKAVTFINPNLGKKKVGDVGYGDEVKSKVAKSVKEPKPKVSKPKAAKVLSNPAPTPAPEPAIV